LQQAREGRRVWRYDNRPAEPKPSRVCGTEALRCAVENRSLRFAGVPKRTHRIAQVFDNRQESSSGQYRLRAAAHSSPAEKQRLPAPISVKLQALAVPRVQPSGQTKAQA